MMTQFPFFELRWKHFLQVSHMMYTLDKRYKRAYGSVVWWLPRNQEWACLMPNGHVLTSESQPAIEYAAEASWQFVMIHPEIEDIIEGRSTPIPLEPPQVAYLYQTLTCFRSIAEELGLSHPGYKST